MTALAGQFDVEEACASHSRTLADKRFAECAHRLVVHSVDFVARETLKQSFGNHAACSTQTFFGGLENKDGSAFEIARLSKILSRTKQHGCMTIMPTGMHPAGILRRVRHARNLVDRQRIHICTQTHTAIAWVSAFQNANDTGFGDARMHLVKAPFF